MSLSDTTRPGGRQVQFMATCLCDAFYPDVARSAVLVLDHLGCQVAFPEDQTCCGQPAFNSGDWASSREVVRHAVDVFRGELPVVVPSGSCAAMMFHGAPLEFEKEKDCAAVQALGGRTWELADYIVHGLGVTQWEGRFPHRVAFHTSCHSRGTRSGQAALQLLSSIDGIDLVAFDDAEQCCGFGGAFSVSFPNISTRMGQLKIENVTAGEPEFLVSGDMGCLMHLGGLVNREGRKVKCLHLAELLWLALGKEESR